MLSWSVDLSFLGRMVHCAIVPKRTRYHVTVSGYGDYVFTATIHHGNVGVLPSATEIAKRAFDVGLSDTKTRRALIRHGLQGSNEMLACALWLSGVIESEPTRHEAYGIVKKNRATIQTLREMTAI